MKKLFALMMIALMLPTAAFAHGDDHKEGIEVSKVWARKTSRTVSAAVYLEIKNNTHQMIELTGASAAIANMTMIHQSYEEDGGYHIMLMGLSQPLEEGGVFPVTLEFEGQFEREVIVEITGIMGLK